MCSILNNKLLPTFMLAGHRGTRGLMPENTIPSMIKAIEDGANVLEMDIQFTADGKVVVAHDPFINHRYSLDPKGQEIPQKQKLVIYQMDYQQVRQYDVGSKHYPSYPKQCKLKTHIPELGELIDAVEEFTESSKRDPIIYNIEIKASPKTDGMYHPSPQHIATMVVSLLKQKNINNRFYIQSFDIRQLQEVRRRDKSIPLGFLTEDKRKTVQDQIDRLGFKPNFYSPYYKLAHQELVNEVQSMGMKFIPWTVNQKKDMKTLLHMNVDGIITDYPGMLHEIITGKQ
ncbi:hypothetical protein BST86_13215 [Nonlabens agnitus]|uniref:GP-PDE domain-containing protein n=1 Tax=Nonlabens agnitus TaxID=870484 RepID=A0A2S9WWX9_9FLAO|nr:hypothetical protein BST86_13215 [Nonlabens agnitus]